MSLLSLIPFQFFYTLLILNEIEWFSINLNYSNIFGNIRSRLISTSMLFYCRLTYTFIPRGKCLDLIPGTFLASKGYKSVLGTQLLLFLSFFSFHQSRIPEDREKFVIIGIISHLIFLKIFCCIKFTNIIIISGIYKSKTLKFNSIWYWKILQKFR